MNTAFIFGATSGIHKLRRKLFIEVVMRTMVDESKHFAPKITLPSWKAETRIADAKICHLENFLLILENRDTNPKTFSDVKKSITSNIAESYIPTPVLH